MQYLKRKTILRYLYEQLTGNFMGFLVGASASSLVSQFFETRSIRNLWGLTSKKMVIDKETFSNLEWIISIIIGFIVFEIMTKIVREKLNRNWPYMKRQIFRFVVANKIRPKMQVYYNYVFSQTAHLISFVGLEWRNAISRLSKR